MASAQKDSSPNQGKKASGMKNNDGRQSGSGGSVKASFKDVGVEPNNGAPELKKNPGHID